MDIEHMKTLLMYPFSRKARKRYEKDFKLIMTLVVKNEEDILETNIRFHHAMGVDGFIVSSHNCTDRTDEILERLQKEGLVLAILKRTDLEHKLSAWVEEMIFLARKFGARWVINADADEFYYSAQLDLKESIRRSEGANALWVDSIFLFPEDREDYLNSSFWVTRPFQKFEAEALGIQGDPLFADFIGSQGCTKVIHKTRGFKKIADGNHDINMHDRVKCHSADIRLYHYHIRSYEGWERKIRRWTESIARRREGSGEHLKAMVRIYQAGKLREVFDKKYGLEAREFLLKQGVVTIDPSVPNFLKYKKLI